MKHLGSIFVYQREREKELYAAFKKEIACCKHINMKEIFSNVVKYPCSRFWVSEERAAIVISEIVRGRPILATASKKEMYREIYKRYKKLKEKNRNVPMSRLIYQVINSPSPQFYLSPSQAKIIINKLRKK